MQAAARQHRQQRAVAQLLRVHVPRVQRTQGARFWGSLGRDHRSGHAPTNETCTPLGVPGRSSALHLYEEDLEGGDGGRGALLLLGG